MVGRLRKVLEMPEAGFCVQSRPDAVIEAQIREKMSENNRGRGRILCWGGQPGREGKTLGGNLT